LDAANKRRAKKETPEKVVGFVGEVAVIEAPNEATLLTMTAESGYTQPKTLRQLEGIVETNGVKGAMLWKKAADALLAIKTHKLWKKAKDENGNPYASFVVYAEQRFGFKKTYAYDLVKAASRKPEALTERAARAEMDAERPVRTVDPSKALELMTVAWVKLEDRLGDIRDRCEDDSFIASYDLTMSVLQGRWSDFVKDWAQVSHDLTPAEQKVSAKRTEEELDDELPA